MLSHSSQPTQLADPMLQLADAMPQLVWMADAEGRVIYFNSRIAEYRGAQHRTDGFWDWFEIIHPDDIATSALIWQNCLVTGVPYETESRMHMADGHFAWHLTRALPQRGHDGTITHWYGTSTNIGRQKAAQQEILESEERFRLLTNSIPQIVWIVGADGTTEYLNDRWESYTGQTRDLAEREGRIEMIHPDDLPVVLDLWAIAQQQSAPGRWEYRLRHKDTGRYRWFAAQIIPLKTDTGAVVKWICAATDIQELKDAAGYLEQEVESRTRELAKLNETLRRQANELLRSNDDLQQFAHVASHDLKEPLRKIRTFGSRLASELGHNMPEQGVQYLNKIETSAHRMADMIDGVLHYSLIDSMEVKPFAVPLEPVFQQIQADLEVVFQKKNAQMVWEQMPVVAGIPLLLTQLFLNLVTNALKFSEEGRSPMIRISSRQVDPVELRSIGIPSGSNYIAVSVSDNGIGFDPSFEQTIFKTFTRLHSKDLYEGTGLGLALCNKIVQRHGGAIRAKGMLGEGAEFTVYLPVFR
jgi:PAS domain S-box-containing protein